MPPGLTAGFDEPVGVFVPGLPVLAPGAMLPEGVVARGAMFWFGAMFWPGAVFCDGAVVWASAAPCRAARAAAATMSLFIDDLRLRVVS